MNGRDSFRNLMQYNISSSVSTNRKLQASNAFTKFSCFKVIFRFLFSLNVRIGDYSH